jgi:hypothetical protein
LNLIVYEKSEEREKNFLSFTKLAPGYMMSKDVCPGNLLKPMEHLEHFFQKHL